MAEETSTPPAPVEAKVETAQESPKEGKAKTVTFGDLEQRPTYPPSGPGNINILLDVPLKMTVQLGKTKMLIKDLLHLGQGSVVELDKIAGDPMDIFLGEKLIARGEIVVVNELFGVRITDIISPAERIETLK